jgi:UDP-glucose 4-epimerase
LNILEAAREFQVKRVIYASSSSVYGNNPTMPKSEDLPIDPLSPYALSKYAGERYCQHYHSIYGLETVCLRYFNVFGPNQNPNSQYSAVIPKFISAIINGQPPTIHGDGKQNRDFTYVANNVHANIKACFQPGIAGQAFNIACGKRYTLVELVKTINAILGAQVKPLFSDTRVGDVKHSLADISKARKFLGYEVIVDFVEGIEKTVDSIQRRRHPNLMHERRKVKSMEAAL